MYISKLNGTTVRQEAETEECQEDFETDTLDIQSLWDLVSNKRAGKEWHQRLSYELRMQAI